MDLMNTLPRWAKDVGVTIGSTYYHYIRRAGVFQQKKEEYRQLWQKPYQEQRNYQLEKLKELFWHAKKNSAYYARKYKDIDKPILEALPILEKEELRQHIDQIVIGDKRLLHKTYSGGTTGKGLVVYASRATTQRRIPFIELYWELHGYHFRDKFAWFTGRHLLGDNDVKTNRFWLTNHYLNIRYYSTFHMSLENIPYYVENLNRYKPKFVTAFPASFYEIARYMEMNKIKPEFQLRSIFTTSETLHPQQRETMESVFNCKVRDQYSASEGAPFVIECPEGNLHMEMASGIFEIVDDSGNPAQEGEVLLTSFHAMETPLIRYRIGDRMRLSDQIGCECGWDTPIVSEIMGRKTDYLDIPGRGKIWCSQFGDCVKGVDTVVKFQVELVNNSCIKVHMVANQEEFEKKDRENFLVHLHERVGDIPVDFVYLDDLPRAKSGKHSVIKKSRQ
jgi:phenylacetate-CoA ligase